MSDNTAYAEYYKEFYAPPEEEAPETYVPETTTALSAAQQTALYYARKRRRARVVISQLTSWMESLTISEGEYVQNIGFAYQALNTGTTGGTPPVHSQGQASDGEITWQFVDQALFSRFVFNAPPTPTA